MPHYNSLCSAVNTIVTNRRSGLICLGLTHGIVATRREAAKLWGEYVNKLLTL